MYQVEKERTRNKIYNLSLYFSYLELVIVIPTRSGTCRKKNKKGKELVNFQKTEGRGRTKNNNNYTLHISRS